MFEFGLVCGVDTMILLTLEQLLPLPIPANHTQRYSSGCCIGECISCCFLLDFDVFCCCGEGEKRPRQILSKEVEDDRVFSLRGLPSLINLSSFNFSDTVCILSSPLNKVAMTSVQIILVVGAGCCRN